MAPVASTQEDPSAFPDATKNPVSIQTVRRIPIATLGIANLVVVQELGPVIEPVMSRSHLVALGDA